MDKTQLRAWFVQYCRARGLPDDQIANFLMAGYLPQPRQVDFHAACRACDRPDGPEAVGFGGARGPGKSHAMLAQLTLDDCQRQPALKCLLLRKVGKAVREGFEDLRTRVLRDVPNDWRRGEGVLVFPNGSRLFLGHFKDESERRDHRARPVPAPGMPTAHDRDASRRSNRGAP